MKKLKRGKKSGLAYFGMADLRSWNPCYDPKKYLPEDFRGTAVDILKHPEIPFKDKLWVVCRTEICSEKLMRLAAVWFYRDTLNWVKNPDSRSIEAANVSERFANGHATKEELAAAESAAWSAAESAAESAVRSAAESAVRSAAWSALSAESAAESAVRSAAWSALSAARSAAESATRSAAESAAESAAWSAAWSAAEDRYKDKLIEMLEIEGKERKRKKR